MKNILDFTLEELKEEFKGDESLEKMFLEITENE